MKLDYETARLVALGREYQEPWSWPKFIAWIVLVNLFCWAVFG